MNLVGRLVAAFALLFAGAALAHSFDAGNLHIYHPWARATPPGVPAAVYFTVESTQGSDRLVSVSTPVAAHAGMHRTVEEGGVVTMQPVESASVSPGALLEFAPGGYHVMLMGLKEPLAEGARFPLTLRFENAGAVTVEVVVQPIVSGDRDHGEHHGH